MNTAAPRATAVEFGSASWWNEYFREGGGWERNGGRQQTRVFADAFCRHVRLGGPRDVFSLLDLGCGLGEAIKIFRSRYPAARLIGMDVSEVAIARCRGTLSDLAEFKVGGIDDASEPVDVLYVSNVLEHFADYQQKARRLLSVTRRLCIMVPFDERRDGHCLQPDSSVHHQHTFVEDDFDFLVTERLASRVVTHRVRCPGAWSIKRGRWMLERMKNPIRRALGRPPTVDRLQIIYDVTK